jgi:competence protein ComEC
MAVAIVCGCAVGLLLLASYPGGLNAAYGLALLAFALGAALCAFLLRHDGFYGVFALMLACTLAGCGLALLRHEPPTTGDVAFYNAQGEIENSGATGDYVTIVGTITAEPTLADRSQTLRISANSILPQDGAQPIPVKGDLLVVVARYPEYSFGEQLSLLGKLTDPPQLGGFDYAAYLAHLGIYSYMSFPRTTSLGHPDNDWLSGSIIAARASARDAIQRTIAEPQAALAVGVVIGDRSSMPDDVKDEFKRTGTTHILAISGENISLLVGLVWLAAGGRKGKRRMPMWLTLLTLATLAAYTAFTGATPSVVRAAVMGAILLVAPLVGRRYDPLAALAVAAAGMVLLDPYVLADSGFQLSYLAMLGITILAPHIYALCQRIHMPAALGLPIATGLAAQAATLPVGILLGGQFALISPIATLTADVALLPLMLSGIITAFLGLVPALSFLAAASGGVAWLSASWLLWWMQFWASVPFASVAVAGFIPLYAVAYYAVLFPLVWLLSDPLRKSRFAATWPRFQPLLLGVTAVAVWGLALTMLFLR